MYPQCRFKAVSNVVKHYASILNPLKCKRVNKCLDILRFSMGNTIMSFQDKYYEYGIDSDPDRRGLTIGGFESAFLADLKASYIFDKLDMLFTWHVHYKMALTATTKLLFSVATEQHDGSRNGLRSSNGKSTICCKQRISNSPWKSGAQELSLVPSRRLSHLCLGSENSTLWQ
jgi:hypothetical protein